MYRFICFVVAFVAVFGFDGESLQADDRPNVLMLLVDDLKPSFGAYGKAWVHSPNLDRLANSGMRFDMAYCNQAVCAPSRNNLLTGARSTSLGVYSLGYHFRRAVPNAVTLPQYFKQHGYHSAGIGKVFHIGHGNINDERSWSVPFQPDKVIDYVLPESTDGKLTREEALFSNKPKTGLSRGAAWEAADVSDDAYADGRIALEGIKRLQAYKATKQPFFLTLGFTKPHLPFCAPKKYWDLYDPQKMKLAEVTEPPIGAPNYAGKTIGELNQYKPVPENPPLSEDMTRTLIQGYYAALSYMDAQLGRVLDELERLELDDNTIVVLWGDHGYHLGDHGMWTKHTNYEQANRIPILIRAPGTSTAGTSSKALVETVDIYPTLCELAGLPSPTGPQPIDGSSLVSILREPTATVRDHAYHCFPKRKRLGRAVRTHRYRLVEWKTWNPADGNTEYELYDYEGDPLETKNLAADRPDVVKQLVSLLNTHPAAKPVHDDSKKKSASNRRRSPEITNRALTIVAQINADTPHGVVLAQGGREHGVALHFRNGKPSFDVRINGKVTQLAADVTVEKRARIVATLSAETMTLRIDDHPALSCPSPGLLPVQPQDGLSIGLDDLSAAGDYEAPNAFNGTITTARVVPEGNESSPKVARPMDRKTIEGGFKTHDRALLVKSGWIRDPYIILGPDDYFYLTGTTPLATDPRQHSDPYNTGLGKDSIVGWKMQAWRSRDLIDWETIDEPFDLKDGIWATARPNRFKETDTNDWKLWAPELHWIGKRWALVHTSPSPVAGANLSLTQGATIGRPWGNPMGAKIAKRHDPSLFKDDDGTWWMIWGATKIAPLAADFTSFSANPVTIGPSGDSSKMGHEGCLMQKIGDKYVLFGTGWSTGLMRRGSYNLYYATSDKIKGPYSERKFVGRFLGHGTPFTDREGRWWCTAFYNANVPPLTPDEATGADLSDTAQTINQQGITIVPLDVRTLDNGEVYIRAKDFNYASPGPDEAQQF